VEIDIGYFAICSPCNFKLPVCEAVCLIVSLFEVEKVFIETWHVISVQVGGVPKSTISSIRVLHLTRVHCTGNTVLLETRTVRIHADCFKS
jgi:hypothetical protein